MLYGHGLECDMTHCHNTLRGVYSCDKRRLYQPPIRGGAFII